MSAKGENGFQPMSAEKNGYTQIPLIEEGQEDDEMEIRPRSEKVRNFLEEHWWRCPPRMRSDRNSCSSFGTALILFCERALTVYNVTADMVVSNMIDRHKDPGWFDAAYYCMLPPIIAKLFLFNRYCMREFEQNKFLSYEAWALYLLLGPWFYAVSDYYILILYPWVRPSHNRTLMQAFERLSLAIEGCLQTLFQCGFHVYLFMELSEHPDLRERYAELHFFLPFSVIPAIILFLYSMYSIAADSSRIGLGFCPYVNELYKAPRLCGRAPLYELLSTQQEISFKGLGKLDVKHQQAIFDAISCERNTVMQLFFDDENDVDFDLCASKITKNFNLEYVSFGKTMKFYDVLAVLEPLEAAGHPMTVAFCNVVFTREARAKWLERARCADPGSDKVHPVAAYFIHHANHIRKVGVKEPSAWQSDVVFEHSDSFGECKKLLLEKDKKIKRKDVQEDQAKMSAKGKYACCVKASDGNIYALPFNAEQVLKIDTKTGLCSLVGPKLSGKMKYECCIEHKSIIYGIPYDASHVLAFDFELKILQQKHQKADFVGDPIPGQWKYSCCESYLDTIYGIPRDGEYVLAVDTAKTPREIRLIGDRMPGPGKYVCCARGADGVIYGIPYNAHRVLAFNPRIPPEASSAACKFIGDKMAAACKYECCITSRDRTKIYGIPSSADQILMIDLNDHDIDQQGAIVRLVGKPLPGNGKYSCCTLGPEGDDTIYAIPNNAEQILAFNPATEEWKLVGEPLDGEWKYLSCTVGSDDIIYAMPNNAKHILAFDPKTLTTTHVGSELQGISKYYCCCIDKPVKLDKDTTAIVPLSTVPAGSIYGIPHDATHILSFNPDPPQKIQAV